MKFFEEVNLTTDSIIAIAPQGNQQPLLPKTNKQVNKTTSSFEGILLIFLLIIYVSSIFYLRRYRRQKKSARLQTIKMLERCWMTSSNK
jgi:heme/copper-type cytochrome/quinol oxidase subunit 2